ncbi:MAG: hypothetical protein ACE363_02135 [Alphaproteobacteria bacterium]
MDLDRFEQLRFLAEISATLLGFIAVFLILSNQRGRFSESDRHFVQAMISSGSMAVLAAIIPSGLSLFVTGDLLWTIALALAATLAVPAMFLQLKHQLVMSEEEAAKIHWGWHAAAWGMGLAAFALIVLGLIGLGDSDAMYVAAVSLIVVLALWSFVSVVFRNFF